ncbi:MAG: radical SAM family heme chaperone HemW [Deltaproteobacteria bacterium]|jgi:oxygen-independent coproporphyrinogen-3 oxidase|nr:radical SAM family heme chaperone HemW [Deltaproteobacteria bacterium]MBW2533536.1 radical SAM family heme chaperone HemW [Deltaproteobacteria bacterium]
MSLLSPLRSVVEAYLERTILQPAVTAPVEPQRIFAAAPIAMYVHVPFCGAKCAYCAFNKERRSPAQIEAYLRAVSAEVDWYGSQPRLAKAPLSSLYIGGGTPSFVPAELLATLLDTIRRRFHLPTDLQVTLEANPESVTADKLACYVRAGVNRISLGAQSFDDAQLRRLGRQHDGGRTRTALRLIRAAGIDEVNLDLMYGLPGQTLDDFATDLQQALSTSASHIALFPLVHQPTTPLGRRQPARRPLLGMYEHALYALERAGFRQYTTEDFTRTVPCRYNVDAWQPPPADCLALGAGALSSLAATHWHNIGDIDRYVAVAESGRPPIAGASPMPPREQMIEHVLLATRTLRFDPGLFEQRFGVPVERALGPWPTLARALGLARRDPAGTVELSPRGRLLASRLWSAFILEKLAQTAADRGPVEKP